MPLKFFFSNDYNQEGYEKLWDWGGSHHVINSIASANANTHTHIYILTRYYQSSQSFAEYLSELNTNLVPALGQGDVVT